MKVIELKDQMGRALKLSQPVTKIICLNPSQTETLVDLGLEKLLVGVTKFCVHPAHLRKTKTLVGGTKKVNYDTIRDLNPDIILCNKEENTKEIVETLEKEYPVHVADVANLEDALEMITQYGQLFNCQQKAKTMCTEINSEKMAWDNLIKLREHKRVVYCIWKDPWMVAGGGTFINEMLSLNGYENVFSKSDRYPTVTLDELKKLSLDLVLLSSEPFPFKESHQKELEKALTIDVKLVDGEYFSWYGSRLLKAFAYFKSLHSH